MIEHRRETLKITINYKPHKKQSEFHDCNLKFRAFVGGVGSGKTYAGCKEAIMYALKNAGSRGAIIAPTYPMLRDVTRDTFFHLCPKEVIKVFLKGENKLVLINGSIILFRSADQPDKLRGLNLAWFYIDEAAFVSYYTWRVLIGRLRQPGFRYKAWITTTPKGFNWVYTKFSKEPRTNYKAIYCTTYENPFLEPEFVQDLEQEYTGVFRDQEIMGKFVAFEGVVYRNFHRDVHIRKLKGMKFNRYIGAIDWGFTNPTAVLVIGIDEDERFFIINEYYARRRTTKEIISILENFQKQYGIDKWWSDPSAAEYIYECKNAGLDITGANNDIMGGLQKVSGKLELQGDGKAALFIDETCVSTIMEFENYRYPDNQEEKPLQEKPLKVHDHCFVGDTPILTREGNKRIEDVTTDDQVLTSKGWKRVLKSWQTSESEEIYELSISDGRKIRCTKHHPFYVKGRGWVSLDALRYFNILVDSFIYTWQYDLMVLDTIKLKMMDIVIQTVSRKPYVLDIKRLNKKQPVYNLHVEDCHEFFANGILVHNCMDALRYAVMSMSDYGSFEILDDEGLIF